MNRVWQEYIADSEPHIVTAAKVDRGKKPFPASAAD